jgi:homoserine O-acetyltransferase
MIPRIRSLTFVSAIFTASCVFAAEYPTPTEGDYVVRDFKFTSGETLPELRLHYRTLGKPEKDAQGKTTNAVLIMHGTNRSGAQFVPRPEFADELFERSAARCHVVFIILPDGSATANRASPATVCTQISALRLQIDMVEAQYRLVDGRLGVNHARLVMGTSMGGCTPGCGVSCIPISWMRSCHWRACSDANLRRNRGWRRIIIDAIRNDPDWRGGDSAARDSHRAAHRRRRCQFMSSNPVLRQKEAPTPCENGRRFSASS